MSRPRPSTGCPRSSTVTGTPASASASAARVPRVRDPRSPPRRRRAPLERSAWRLGVKVDVGSSSQSRLTRSSFFGLGRMSSLMTARDRRAIDADVVHVQDVRESHLVDLARVAATNHANAVAFAIFQQVRAVLPGASDWEAEELAGLVSEGVGDLEAVLPRVESQRELDVEQSPGGAAVGGEFLLVGGGDWHWSGRPDRPLDRPVRPSASSRAPAPLLLRVLSSRLALVRRVLLPLHPRPPAADTAVQTRRLVNATPRSGTRAPACRPHRGGHNAPRRCHPRRGALRSIVAIVRRHHWRWRMCRALADSRRKATRANASNAWVLVNTAAVHKQTSCQHIAEQHVARLSWRRDERFPRRFRLRANKDLSTRDIISPGRAARTPRLVGQPARPISSNSAWLPTRLRLWARRARSRPSTCRQARRQARPRGYGFHRRGGEDPRARRRERGRSQGAPREFEGRVPDGGVPEWLPPSPSVVVIDTLELLRGFERAGFSAQQAEAITRATLAVTKSSVDPLATKSDLERHILGQLSELREFKQDIGSRHREAAANSKHMADMVLAECEKLRAELRYTHEKVTSSQKLDLNLERGRIRDDLTAQDNNGRGGGRLDREMDGDANHDRGGQKRRHQIRCRYYHVVRRAQPRSHAVAGLNNDGKPATGLSCKIIF